MTKIEFLEKYGNCPVKFYRYYKNCFEFRGSLPNATVEIDVEHDYRLEVIADFEYTVLELDPHEGRSGDDEFFEY